MNLPNKELRNEINQLWKKLFEANEQNDEKVGLMLTFGSVLNAYREADVSFEEAVNLCNQVQEYNLKQNGIVLVKRNGETYTLLVNEPIEKGQVILLDSCQNNHNVFWLYECTGLHIGKSIKVIVKNPRLEPDSDDWNIYYVVDYDNLLWADDLKDELIGDVYDTYSGLILDAIKEDLRED